MSAPGTRAATTRYLQYKIKALKNLFQHKRECCGGKAYRGLAEAPGLTFAEWEDATNEMGEVLEEIGHPGQRKNWPSAPGDLPQPGKSTADMATMSRSFQRLCRALRLWRHFGECQTGVTPARSLSRRGGDRPLHECKTVSQARELMINANRVDGKPDAVTPDLC